MLKAVLISASIVLSDLTYIHPAVALPVDGVWLSAAIRGQEHRQRVHCRHHRHQPYAYRCCLGYPYAFYPYVHPLGEPVYVPYVYGHFGRPRRNQR